MVDIQYLLKQICDIIEKEQRYRSFRQKNHICILFDKKKIYSMGVNYTISQGSIHSEMDAFNRLIYNPKKVKKINMLVVRVCYEHASEKKNKYPSKPYTHLNKFNLKHGFNRNKKFSTTTIIDSNSISEDEQEPSLQDLNTLMNKDKITCIENYLKQIQISNNLFDGIRFRISKPCYHCIQHILLSCNNKNYIVKKIYYSIDVNKIYETNLEEAILYPHISSYYKMCNQSIFWNNSNMYNILSNSKLKLRNRIE